MNWQRLAWVLGIWMCCVAQATVAADNDTAVATERARIKAEQAAVRSRFARDEAACYQRFAVNDCLQEAKARQREALNGLRRQEIALNDVERKKKSEERIRRLEEKAKDARLVPGSTLPEGSQAVPTGPAPTTAKGGRARADKDRRVAVEMAPRQAKPRKAPRPRLDGKPPGAADTDTKPAAGRAGPTPLEREQARQERASRRDKALAERKKPPANPLPVPP